MVKNVKNYLKNHEIHSLFSVFGAFNPEGLVSIIITPYIFKVTKFATIWDQNCLCRQDNFQNKNVKNLSFFFLKSENFSKILFFCGNLR